ncbi:hypothetical protein HS088_TW23G00539 [Tripterygium wilfordii]|uniref:Uncharacterized protein n=1 Tax=Tripterygium wilfordii TaxID=458696 RepID=A0A7J7BV88_TRIWF|nr:uncharacterized protein LOC119993821 [Tripterygium wilfordii]KAF5725810.1 hypothetical protein HS088_TW23G00539 [Tripterygium wilfordii]
MTGIGGKKVINIAQRYPSHNCHVSNLIRCHFFLFPLSLQIVNNPTPPPSHLSKNQKAVSTSLSVSEMATNLLTFRPAVIQASAISKTDLSSRKASPNWWSPIFGFSSEPDYINGGIKEDHQDKKQRKASESDPDPNPKSSRSRFSRGCFTEEKARQLRMMIMDTETHHDAMYHSAIASRLASDFGQRSDP